MPKPRLRLTQWWRDLVHHREKRQGRVSRWSEAGCLLLDVPYEDQRMFERLFRQAIVKVRKSSQLTASEVVRPTQPCNQRQEAVLGVAYKRLDRDQRVEAIQQAVAVVHAQTGAQRLVTIGQDVKRADYPCTSVAYLLYARDGADVAPEEEE